MNHSLAPSPILVKTPKPKASGAKHPDMPNRVYAPGIPYVRHLGTAA